MTPMTMTPPGLRGARDRPRQRRSWVLLAVSLVLAALLPAPAPAAAVVAADVKEARAAYDRALDRVEVLGERSGVLDERAQQAAVDAEELRRTVQDEEVGGVLAAVGDLLTPGRSQLERAADAALEAQRAQQSAAKARGALADAVAEAEQARLAWERALDRKGKLETMRAARLAAATASQQAEFRPGYEVWNHQQDLRNRAALRRWQSYLAALGDAGVVPPRAAQLLDPDRLEDRFNLLRDGQGRPVVGVAEIDPARRPPLVVLPAETIRAVSEAFSRVGLPDDATPVGAEAYACGGLAAQAWSATSIAVPADSVRQWQQLRSVPRAQLQVGDLVVLGDRRSGLERTGVYVGRGSMIAVDPSDGMAAVESLPKRQVHGVKRAPLPSSRTYPTPPAPACGAPADEITSPGEEVDADGALALRGGTAPFLLPVPAGSYRLSAAFGAAGHLWSSGQHSGQDFAAPVGTPVYAAADGVAVVETPSWAGNLIRLDHGGGVETWYAHLSSVSVNHGERVTAGEPIGTVGSEGNSTGPHLHFELRLDGSPVDPMRVLAPAAPLSATARYDNGEIPASALCTGTPDGLGLLRCDAAVAFRLMSVAYEAEMGSPLCVTDTYRSRTGQEELYRTKPGLAAVPGTSNHGWGVAVDLCGGVERFGTPEHEWLLARGEAFGWHHPDWAAEGGNRPEPWHFEYAS